VNIKILIQTNTFEFFGVLSIVLSVASFYVIFGVVASWQSSDMFSLLSVLLSFENQYFLLFFFMTAYILVEYGIKILQTFIHNDIEED
jgi:hypothetical protein